MKTYHSRAASLRVNLTMLLAVVSLLIIVALPAASAIVESFGVFKQYQAVNLIQTYNSTACNISSITSPNSTVFAGGAMTKSGLSFNYTFTNTASIGKYNVCGDCNQAAWCANFEITTTGSGDGNTIPLFLLLGGFILMAAAIVTKNEYFGFFSGAVFIVAGVYMMIYGLGMFADNYTRTISYISLGLGVILCVASVYETVWGNEDDGDAGETED